MTRRKWSARSSGWNGTSSASFIVRARVFDTFAKCAGAFSISARILRYELVDTETPNFFALVTQAEVPDEISLTDRPCDPCALVLRRSAPAALPETHAKVLDQVAQLKAMLAALPVHLLAAPKREPATSPGRVMTQADRARLMAIHERMASGGRSSSLRERPPAPRRPTSRGSFSELAAELNSRQEA
jgi:hypothetical protein